MRETEIIEPELKKQTCSECGWTGLTTLSKCYRRKEHADREPKLFINNTEDKQT